LLVNHALLKSIPECGALFDTKFVLRIISRVPISDCMDASLILIDLFGPEYPSLLIRELGLKLIAKNATKIFIGSCLNLPDAERAEIVSSLEFCFRRALESESDQIAYFAEYFPEFSRDGRDPLLSFLNRSLTNRDWSKVLLIGGVMTSVCPKRKPSADFQF
jgi:hypothetical protein